MSSFAGLEETSQPAGSLHATLFIKPAKQCFPLTTNQPEQYFSAKFQTSERGHCVVSVVIIVCTQPYARISYTFPFSYHGFMISVNMICDVCLLLIVILQFTSSGRKKIQLINISSFCMLHWMLFRTLHGLLMQCEWTLSAICLFFNFFVSGFT